MGLTLAGLLLLAYLLGSIPFGFLIVKFTTHGDVRQVGSGSTGATNVTRSAGLKAGLLTYLLDVAKGVAAVWLAGTGSGQNLHAMGAAGALCILGHMYPVFLGFRGGKGVATGVGVFLMLAPLATGGALLVWVLLFAITRTVSLGSIVATALLPVLIWVLDGMVNHVPHPLVTAKCLWAAGIGLLIVAKHHENIRRLLSGTESTFRKQTEEK
ncbi:MAG: glycerol-3-phosphate 1-O-acyltransferase PlsY [Blastocatellia bacterium]|nr:glycerol-3-phosphate 1-O-acyltransferase PlsY [Blastocatellia bacterium]